MSNSYPNMIFVSGREDLPIEDRLALLEADVDHLRRKITPGADIHLFKSLIGAAHNEVVLGRRRLAKNGFTPTNLIDLSEMECEIMAWKRGGAIEHQRVRHAQMRKS